MNKLGKKRTAAFARVDRLNRYSAEDAIKLVKGCKTARFDESVDVAIKLGVDPVSYTHLTLPTILRV